VWSVAGETLRRGRGDCEDYAIAKLQMLRHAGFADRDLYLVVVKDLVRRSDHAVLVVRAEGRMLLLDNGTDRIADAASAQDYRPVLSFAAGHVWTHGYQRSQPPVTIAEATPAPVVTASLGDQRSRNASLRALSTGFNR
jgi:predicted transglutaminase-like cysteine proteinase